MAATVPQVMDLIAPAAWRTVDFISDLHLQASEPATFTAWQHYMQSTPADAVLILGDLFEVWVGDDVVADPAGTLEARCARIVQAAAQRCAVYFMHGNRDFLLGQAYAQSSHLTLLPDPTVLTFGGQRYLLSHGDALCLEDTQYLAFRKQVRAPEWRRHFLQKPLAERLAIARTMRQQSEAHKRSVITYADVDANAACAWLRAAQASQLIHGHTHRPADHPLAEGLSRRVLSDWDGQTAPVRAQVLRLSWCANQGVSVARVAVDRET